MRGPHAGGEAGSAASHCSAGELASGGLHEPRLPQQQACPHARGWAGGAVGAAPSTTPWHRARFQAMMCNGRGETGGGEAAPRALDPLSWSACRRC